ncbi:MAG TPA: VOC family protein [Chthoniobacterales bacterium]|jgi:predicted enzyme related to lactoylglutathione lyase|nr:VOC family protein [Chthoniobacterales bacterium]
MKISEIAFVAYPVIDIERSRGFYEGVLGLQPSREFTGESYAWIEYDLGANTFAVAMMPPGQWNPSADGPSVGLEVEEFDSAIAELKARSIPFDVEAMETPVCRMAVIADPDGNKITIHKRHPQVH